MTQTNDAVVASSGGGEDILPASLDGDGGDGGALVAASFSNDARTSCKEKHMMTDIITPITAADNQVHTWNTLPQVSTDAMEMLPDAPARVIVVIGDSIRQIFLSMLSFS